MNASLHRGLRRPENREDNQCGIVVDQAIIDVHGIWTCIIYNQRNQTYVASRNVIVPGDDNKDMVINKKQVPHMGNNARVVIRYCLI